MLLGISLFDPLGGVGQDIVAWFGHSISQGIGGFASWAIGGVIHAMQSTTTPDFKSWFKGPWGFFVLRRTSGRRPESLG